MHTSPGSGVLISARSGFYLGFVVPFGLGRQATGISRSCTAGAVVSHLAACTHPLSHIQPSPPLPHLPMARSPLNTKHWARAVSAASYRHLDTRFPPSPRRGVSMKRGEKLRSRLNLFSFWHKCGSGRLDPLSPAPTRTPSPLHSSKPVAALLECWGG